MAHKAQLSRKEQTAKERQVQHEDLLIAIDQLEQITEVMSEVLGKIKQQAVSLEPGKSNAKNTRNITKKARTSKDKKINPVH